MNLRIRIVQESDATGETRDLYNEIREYFGIGLVPDIFKLVSTRPDFLRVMSDGYKAMFFTGVLPRQVKEMIATVVSAANSCAYCTRAHSLLLRSAGGSPEAVEASQRADIEAMPVEDRYRALLRLCLKLTKHAYKVTDEDIHGLRAAGLTDDEILEGVFVACEFNAIDRLADSLGLYELMQLKDATEGR